MNDHEPNDQSIDSAFTTGQEHEEQDNYFLFGLFLAAQLRRDAAPLGGEEGAEIGYGG